jgi:hypothetical protein
MSEERSIGWQRQNKVYIVMYQSRRSGGTYTELRRTEAGLNRLIDTLLFMGYSREDISVSEQRKLWMPEFKGTKKKSNRRRTLGVVTGEQRLATKEQEDLRAGTGSLYLQ